MSTENAVKDLTTTPLNILSLLPEEVLNLIIASYLPKPFQIATLGRLSRFFHEFTKSPLRIAINQSLIFKQINALLSHSDNNAEKKDQLLLLKELQKIEHTLNHKKDFEEKIDNIIKTNFKGKSALFVMDHILTGETMDALNDIYKKLPDVDGQKGYFGPQKEAEKEEADLDWSAAMGAVY